MDKENTNNRYTELSPEGRERARVIVEKFRKQLEEISNSMFYDFGCTMAEEIVDCDAWDNWRTTVLNKLCDYGDPETKMAGTYEGQWWTNIRKKILEENREAIINDIILDKEYEIKQLKKTIDLLQETSRYIR